MDFNAYLYETLELFKACYVLQDMHSASVKSLMFCSISFYLFTCFIDVEALDLESSDDSCQDFDDAEENLTTDTSAGAAGSRSAMTDRSSGVDCSPEDESTTSWEDMSRLDPHLLLYKACGARNLPVMLQALANKADPNWVNLDDGGRTPIMRAVITVRARALTLLSYT